MADEIEQEVNRFVGDLSEAARKESTFLDFLDEAQGKVVFVNSKELVDLTQG